MAPFRLILVFLLFSHSAASFGNGVTGRDDPFSHADVAHGYHIHVPIDYVLGEGMSYGLARQFLSSMHIAFAPIFSLNGDRYARLINLEGINHGRTKNFESQDSGNIYKQNKSITVGLGLDFHITFGLPVASFSLLPQRTKYTYVERRIAHKKDAKKLSKKVIIPSNEEELSNWQIGDRLFFKKTASLTFMIDGGLEPILYTGPLFNVSGSWIIGFEKMSENKMRFSVTRNKIKGFGYELDGLVFSIGLEHFRGRDRLFQFDLDLSSAQARQVLLDLMKGKLDSAQEAVKNISSGVEEVEYSMARSRGLSIFQVFVIPFLYGASHSASRATSSELEEEVFDDSKEVSSVVVDQVSTVGALSKHKLRMSVSLANLELKKNDETTFAGAYSWVYEKDDRTDEDIKDRLAYLGTRIGLNSQLHFDHLSNKEGYAKIQFLNRLSMSAVIQLVNKVSSQPRAAWLVKFENAARAYFDRNSSLQGFDDTSKSYRKFIKKGEEKLKDILVHLKDAKSYMYKKEYKNFTREIAKGINLIHSNPAVFSCFMKQIDGYEAYLALEGENVPMQSKKLVIP